MPRLVLPDAGFRCSFLTAMDEFDQAWAGGEPDDSQTAGWVDQWGDAWGSDAGFGAFVAHVRAQEVDPRALPERWVLTSVRWWVDDATYLGRIAVRHELNDFLREVGGHIGYDVRPSARRQGHATAMLRAVLPLARDLGIDPALVTCDPANAASIQVIAAAGGVLEDVRAGRCRHWVPTS